MGNPLVDLVIGLLAFGLIVGTVGMMSRRDLYDRIGAGGTSLGEADPEDPPQGSPEAHRQRQDEMRQMLQARSDRLVRQGESPLDVEAELERLMDPASIASDPADRRSDGGRGAQRHDPQLVEELHQLATARNQRRLRNGEPPLDVQAEVARALSELES